MRGGHQEALAQFTSLDEGWFMEETGSGRATLWVSYAAGEDIVVEV